jgi:hypothetical protein
MIQSILNFFYRLFIWLFNPFKEAIICFSLGLRDGLHYRLAAPSFFWGAFLTIFWLVVFIVWYQEILQACFALSLIIIFYVLKPYYISMAPVGAGASIYPGVAGLIVNIPLFLGGSILFTVLGFLLVLSAYILVVMLSLRIVLELLLMDRVQKHCLRRYPSISRSETSSLSGNLRNLTGSLAWLVFGGLFCLMTPFAGPLLLFTLSSYLNFRCLADDALKGIADSATIRHTIKGNRLAMTYLGAMSSIFMLIPVIGFFAPGVMGSAACHLCMRKVTNTSPPGN